MEVVIYRAREKGGYIYDMSLNPSVDLEILKRTRKIDSLSVITPEIPIEIGEAVLKSIYSTSGMIGKLITSQDFIVNSILKRMRIKRIDKRITSGGAIPDTEDMSKVEERITGRVVSIKELSGLKDRLGLGKSEIIDIVQALYCERRIRMVPSVKMSGSRRVCSFCGKQPCKNCCLGFKDDDILLYEADNYNIKEHRTLEVKKLSLSEPLKRAHDEFISFLKSRRDAAILWFTPGSFDFGILSGGMADIIRSGGKILYVTSTSETFKTVEAYREIMKGIKIEDAGSMMDGFRNDDIIVDSLKNYSPFYKAFDLVILDKRLSFTENYSDGIDIIYRRAVKEKGKFIIITCFPDKDMHGLFRSTPDIISVPVLRSGNPISEPRIVLSRLIKGPEPFIPQMVIDMINWSIGEGTGIIIFVPDEIVLSKVYYYLTSLERFDRNIIDISTKRDKSPVMKLKKKQIQILISTDFKDAAASIEDVNVIVMNSDDSAYRTDTLINMAAMAVTRVNKKLGEVVFVASDETDTISLAKSTIRSINKMAWERGYIKK